MGNRRFLQRARCVLSIGGARARTHAYTTHKHTHTQLARRYNTYTHNKRDDGRAHSVTRHRRPHGRCGARTISRRRCTSRIGGRGGRAHVARDTRPVSTIVEGQLAAGVDVYNARAPFYTYGGSASRVASSTFSVSCGIFSTRTRTHSTLLSD